MAEDPPVNASSLFDLTGRIALVTGGGSGIGFYICRALVANGAIVYTSSRKGDVLGKVADELTKMGPGKCIAIAGDLTSKKACDDLAAELRKHTKKLDILVNNAGMTWGAPMESFPENRWHDVFSLNVYTPYYLTVACLDMLKAANRGPYDPPRVVMIGSVAGITQNENMNNPSYAASKAAIHHLTKVMAAMLGPKGITVNCIAPGVFPSRMARFYTDNSEMRDATVSQIPLGRLGTPADIAGLILFMTSRGGAYLNGTVIPYDGGHSLASKNLKL
ncbi:hypothetical protein SmJEL517_g01447 [Synchytrium microbalum]|uniref:Gluconate 5-dehydrogenase n=1 Tax=Synchytrium microbalum TaxID=1806994 RepID=A0A507C5A1_9FUNG|nr:uncharacterized protein SmJEL517_g01447 [Synchytrium microbalum]TPX36167.1 hypothetical protein SmJEL517_g01447 [Synchytrium microbalum]